LSRSPSRSVLRRSLSRRPPLTATPTTTAGTCSQNVIYVANRYSNSVTTYLSTWSGDPSPLATIAATSLQVPQGIAVDSSGKVYVTGFNVNTSAYSVFIFPPLGSSTGLLNETPATIGGSKTGLFDPTGIALDSGHNVYVSDPFANYGPNPSIFEWYSGNISTQGAALNVAPNVTIAGSKTGLNNPGACGWIQTATYW
jgi:hypothetical protein